MSRNIPERSHRRAGLVARAARQRFHHPDFDARSTQGWAPWTMTRRRFDLSETAKQIDISVRDSILFDVDRDVLKADAVAVLKDIKTLLLDRQPYSRLVVEGHTDDRGTAAYNLALSSRRAEAVAAWLSQNGVLRERLEIKGLGRTSPLVPNANDANRAKNRRVEIKLIKPS